MGPTVSDAELLEAILRGERAAFGTLVERYQPLVAAVSYSRTRDASLSEDVAQETFLAAWRQLDQLREPRRLAAWLCGIAKNVARKARRKSDRETPSEAPPAIARDNPFDAVAEAEAERVVGEALGRVPDSYRDVLVLYYREQRSAKEVSAMLGISEAATLQRLARGRQYLADSVTALVSNLVHDSPVTSVVQPLLTGLLGPSSDGTAHSSASAAHDVPPLDTSGVIPTALFHPPPLHLGFLGQPTVDGHEHHDGAFSALGVHHF